MSTDIELPPLPECYDVWCELHGNMLEAEDVEVPIFVAKQMQDYARAAVLADRERRWSAPDELPPAYLFAKLAMVMPLFQEARDALPAISENARILNHIRKDLADRMDIAGTYSVDDWQDNHPERAS